VTIGSGGRPQRDEIAAASTGLRMSRINVMKPWLGTEGSRIPLPRPAIS
jgi:hypothetical protein